MTRFISQREWNQYADLSAAKQNFVYQVERIETEEKQNAICKILGSLSEVKSSSSIYQGNNAILLIKSHRVGVSREILSRIFVNKKTASSESWTSRIN